MAHLFIFPEKDATIFSRKELQLRNSGNDAILEIEKTYVNTEKSLARSLIKFNLNDIKSKINSGQILNPKFYLILKTMEAREVPLEYSILCYPISQSWEMGVGRKYDEYTTEGVSWKYRDAYTDSGNLWFTHSLITSKSINHSDFICYNYTGSDYWNNILRWSGSFSGKFVGKIWSGSFSGSYNINGTSGSYLDLSTGSLEGDFLVVLNGAYTGSIMGTYYSSSYLTQTIDASLTSYAGGGTWYLNEFNGGFDWCEQTSSLCCCPETSSENTGSGSTSSFDSGSTASFDTGSTASFDSGSGDYICSQSFKYEKSDIKMDITKIVYAWLNNEIPNEGILLRHSGECDDNDYGLLRYFSLESNTIYAPRLDIAWSDCVFYTGSLQQLDLAKNNVVYMNNLNHIYKYGSKIRVDVFGRDKFIRKSFDRHVIDYQNRKHLPITSYYSIKDSETEEVWLDFDEYTKLSCDETGNYFILNTMGLPQERFFKITIKSVYNDIIQFYEDDNIFKITR
jgi:hypothetical protein